MSTKDLCHGLYVELVESNVYLSNDLQELVTSLKNGVCLNGNGRPDRPTPVT